MGGAWSPSPWIHYWTSLQRNNRILNTDKLIKFGSTFEIQSEKVICYFWSLYFIPGKKSIENLKIKFWKLNNFWGVCIGGHGTRTPPPPRPPRPDFGAHFVFSTPPPTSGKSWFHQWSLCTQIRFRKPCHWISRFKSIWISHKCFVITFYKKRQTKKFLLALYCPMKWGNQSPWQTCLDRLGDIKGPCYSLLIVHVL